MPALRHRRTELIRHFAHLSAARDAGQLILAGRSSEPYDRTFVVAPTAGEIAENTPECEERMILAAAELAARSGPDRGQVEWRAPSPSTVYSLLRHPIYAGYLITHVAFLAAHPSLWNLVVFVVSDTALMVHPEDARRLGLRDGEEAVITSRVGEVKAPVSDEEFVGGEAYFVGPGHTPRIFAAFDMFPLVKASTRVM